MTPSVPSTNSAQKPKLPEPPGLGKRLVRYILGFGVSLAIGLAPFLGKVDIPLFDSLLSILPESEQAVLIPLSSALMAVIAVAVQWWAISKVSGAWLQRVFSRILVVLATSFALFLIVHNFWVVRVPIAGGDEYVSFLVGFNRPIRSPCGVEISDSRCIALLTFDPTLISSFWGDRAIRVSRLLVFVSYLSFMGAFGALVGLLILKE